MEAMEEALVAIKDLRADFEKGTLTEEKQAKIETVLNSYEEKNAEITKITEQVKAGEEQIAELKASLEEKGVDAGKTRELVEKLEIDLAKQIGIGQKNAKYGESDEYKKFQDYVKRGSDDFTNEEVKAVLRTDSATEGGVLATSEMETQMIKYLTELDEIRGISRVRSIAAKQLTIAVRTGIPIAQYEGEAEEGIDSNSTYGNETLTAFRQTHTIGITRDMLMDSAFDMESEIMMDSAEAFSYGEGRGFLVGSGHKQPYGILTDERVLANSMTSLGEAGVMSPDDPIKVQGELKTGYGGSFILNRRTLADLRLKKSTDGNYLWAPGLNGGSAATIAGASYTIANSMPDIANDSYPLLYGAFRTGYMIIDRTATEVIRDDYTQKKRAIVEFTIHRWNTGKVVVPEAIIPVQINS